ncbi:MAG: hypothetical protein CMO32_36965 [Variovorax sp.]|nr:hypothetical protein [Variovorax sp.]
MQTDYYVIFAGLPRTDGHGVLLIDFVLPPRHLVCAGVIPDEIAVPSANDLKVTLVEFKAEQLLINHFLLRFFLGGRRRKARFWPQAACRSG